jgi:SH3-like domain-containing protein
MKQIIFIISLFTLVPTAAIAEYVSVKVPVANIRSEPNDSGDPAWKVEAYYPLFVLEKKGDWYRFRDFEGDMGWIYAPLVNRDEAVITIKEDCNIRSGPSTQNDIVFKAEIGIPFKVLTKKGSWLNVLHTDGDRGWIHKSLVWPAKWE